MKKIEVIKGCIEILKKVYKENSHAETRIMYEILEWVLKKGYEDVQ